MKKICILAAAVVIAASPALAQSGRKTQAQRAPQAVSSDPHGGQKRYTDPDPNIQFEVMRQQQWRKGG
jgi:hypothetical protein